MFCHQLLATHFVVVIGVVVVAVGVVVAAAAVGVIVVVYMNVEPSRSHIQSTPHCK